MPQNDAIVAVFADHQGAEAGIKKLAEAGFDMKKLTLIGKGYHSEEKIIGFYNTGDRVRFWGKYGAFWGGLWGLLFGGIFITGTGVGPVVVLGYLAAVILSGIESAVVVGAVSALGAALYSIGIPRDSVLSYESAVKADGFLVMAHGTAEEMARAKGILNTSSPSRVDVHEGLPEVLPAGHSAPAAV